MPSKTSDNDSKRSGADSISIIIGKMSKPPKKSSISVDGKKSSTEEDIEASMEAEEKGEMEESVCPHCGKATHGEENEEGDESITPPKNIGGVY